MYRLISKIEHCINFVNNKIFRYKNLIILAGYDGITLIPLKNKLELERLYIPYQTKDFSKRYRNFIRRYKDFNITILLDTKDCKISNLTIPVVSSAVKINPVNKFITENYSESDITAYNIYNISHQASEVWRIMIANCKYISPIKNLIEFVVKHYKYGGIYLLSLEYDAIIRKILRKTNNLKHKNDLQLFITFCQSGYIKFVEKRKSHILQDLMLPIDVKESHQFIKGTIQQLINDQLIIHKEYIAKHRCKPCIVLLVNDDFKSMLINSAEFKYKLIIASPQDLDICNANQDFSQEATIVKLCNKNTRFPAYNKELKQLLHCNFINKFIFKPVLLFIVFLLFKLMFIQYQIHKEKANTKKVKLEYFDLTKKYREQVNKYPNPSNVHDVFEYYSLTRKLQQPIAQQIKTMTNILNISLPYASIKNISWGRIAGEKNNDLNGPIKILVRLKYQFNTRQLDLDTIANQYISEVLQHLNSFDGAYRILENESYWTNGKHIVFVDYTFQQKDMVVSDVN